MVGTRIFATCCAESIETTAEGISWSPTHARLPVRGSTSVVRNCHNNNYILFYGVDEVEWKAVQQRPS